MSGDAHVRFREHPRGQFPRVTRLVIGVQYRSDGERLRAGLEQRLSLYGLKLHPEKTRPIEFGRFAQANRAQRGEGKPESFDFLGFTHLCAQRRSDGGFALRRHSVSKRLRAFLQKIKLELRKHLHWSPAQQGAWLASKVRGYFQYHGVPGNRRVLETVRREVNRLWLRTLRRRSQRHALTWEKFNAWVRRWIPSSRIVHPYPNQRFAF